MGFEDLYPGTGKFRTHHEDVYKASRERLESFKKSPVENLSAMFSLRREEAEKVSPEIWGKILRFAEYAGPRLMNAALSSPMNDPLVKEGQIDQVLYGLVHEFQCNHDLVHAAVSYERTSGRSLTPEFTKLENTNEMYAGTSSIQEELMVHLIFATNLDGSNFIKELFKSNDPIKNYDIFIKESQGEPLVIKKARDEYVAGVEALETMRGSDPAQFYLEIYELFMHSILQIVTADKNADMTSDVTDRAFRAIRATRDTHYVSLFNRLYANSISDDPDTFIELNEFLRMINPILKTRT